MNRMNSPLLDSSNIKDYFATNEVIFVPGFMSVGELTAYNRRLDNVTTMPLPTDHGDVYELYTELPAGKPEETVRSLSRLVAKAAGLSLVPEPEETVIEALRYNHGTNLSPHRDKEGKSVTKFILTLSGSCEFYLECGTIQLHSGDLIILRGSEFTDTLTPLHATKNNINRRILIAEPNYYTAI